MTSASLDVYIRMSIPVYIYFGSKHVLAGKPGWYCLRSTTSTFSVKDNIANDVINFNFYVVIHYDYQIFLSQRNRKLKIKYDSSSNQSSRRFEIILTRLRIRHTRLTHSPSAPLSSHFIVTIVPETPLSHSLTYLTPYTCSTLHNSPNPLPLYQNPY